MIFLCSLKYCFLQISWCN